MYYCDSLKDEKFGAYRLKVICPKLPTVYNGWLVNNRNVVFTVMEDRKSKVKMPTDSMW